MKRFIATLNGKSYINIPADRMVFNKDTNLVMDYKDIANRLRKWANGETCEDCPAKDDIAFCAADAIYDLLSRVEALRPVSREQVEKGWRGEWMFKPFYKGTSRGAIECQKCKSAFEGSVGFNFCPSCGAPMTDEAVEMVMERLEVLHENP